MGQPMSGESVRLFDLSSSFPGSFSDGGEGSGWLWTLQGLESGFTLAQHENRISMQGKMAHHHGCLSAKSRKFWEDTSWVWNTSSLSPVDIFVLATWRCVIPFGLCVDVQMNHRGATPLHVLIQTYIQTIFATMIFSWILYVPLPFPYFHFTRMWRWDGVARGDHTNDTFERSSHWEIYKNHHCNWALHSARACEMLDPIMICVVLRYQLSSWVSDPNWSRSSPITPNQGQVWPRGWDSSAVGGRPGATAAVSEATRSRPRAPRPRCFYTSPAAGLRSWELTNKKWDLPHMVQLNLLISAEELPVWQEKKVSCAPIAFVRSILIDKIFRKWER